MLSRDAYVNFHVEKLKHNLEIVKVLRGVAANHGKSCSATAIRFILDFMPEGVPIVGIKTSTQLRDIATSQDWHLDWPELAQLNSISHSEGWMTKDIPWQKEF